MVDIILPEDVRYIITRLEDWGHSAYAVGGCVRDSLLGLAPKDWDICTSALPGEVAECLAGHRVIETGLQHGTVTVRVNHESYEVTTFRTDGEYSDSRRPDSVEFVRDVTEDLARRDFTMNAMAYNTALVDPFGGAEDIRKGVIRCVGDAETRFGEDALRIMRGLRFAAVLGFSIEDGTAAAMLRCAERLNYIAAERVADELNKMIVGKNILRILMDFCDVLAVPVPEIRPAFGLDQRNPYHCYDAWKHIAVAVAAGPPDLITRLALLLHDIGKPGCFTISPDGIGHFYGHAKVGAEIAQVVLRRLKYPNHILSSVTALVLHHDEPITPTGKSVKRWLNRMSEEDFLRLLEVKRGDALAHCELHRAERLAELDKITPLLDEIIAQGQCFSLKNLAVDGRDMMDIGAEGAQIGELLGELLRLVIADELTNEREVLTEYARNMMEKD